MRLRLSHRINIYIGFTLVLGIGVLLYYDLIAQSRLLEVMGTNEAERLAVAVMDQLYTSMSLGGGRKENRAVIDRFMDAEGIEEIRVVYGKALEKERGVESDRRPVDELDRLALAGETVRVVSGPEKGGTRRSVRVVVPVYMEKRCEGCHSAQKGEVLAALSLVLSLDNFQGFASLHRTKFLYITLAILLVTFLAVFLTVNRRLLRPLERLRKGAERLASGDMTYRVSIKTGDEMEEVGGAFDTMAESILTMTTRLRALSERQSRLLEMAPDSIVLVDVSLRRFVDVNPAAETLTGYSKAELLEMADEDVFPEQKRPQYREVFRRWVHDGKGYLHDAEILRKDGTVVPVEVAAAVVEFENRAYMQEIWRDLSERKGFEAALRRHVEELEETVRRRTRELNRSLKELEEAYTKLKNSETRLIQSAKLASLGEMGAGIAHELNSPLAGILSLTEVLLRRTSPTDPNHRLLEKIKDAATRAKYIILDMLTYARPFKEEFRPIFVNETIRATLTLFVSEIKASSIEVIEELDPELPKVLGNQGQLMEVVLNIIKNARDAMGGRGKIFIRTRTVIKEGREYAEVEIRDTGPGIPEEIKDRIFDPFFTTKEKGGGLNIGLGLSICQGIIHKHGGTIDVESRPGEGAAFRFRIPTVHSAESVGTV